jgi:hypothetical protein
MFFSSDYILINFTIPQAIRDQDTRLRMPNKSQMFKESQASNNKKDNAAACLCFVNYLAFLRPAADQAVSILPWVVSRDPMRVSLGWFDYSR